MVKSKHLRIRKEWAPPDEVYGEVKTSRGKERVPHIISLMRDTALKARKEKKIPVVQLCHVGYKGGLIAIRSQDLREFVEIMKRYYENCDRNPEYAHRSILADNQEDNTKPGWGSCGLFLHCEIRSACSRRPSFE